jgi:hydroxylamine dehydrogenase
MKTVATATLAVMVCAAAGFADDCIECHAKVTSKIVSDWKLSKHSGSDVTCRECHGEEHTSADDVEKAGIATADVCDSCHSDQVDQFKKGKHALAWAAMKAMPTTHYQPMELIQGGKGCGGCHALGIKTKDEIEELRKAGGVYAASSCDVCHTRHLFSAVEARQPQACMTCHMGFDHPQWEMYSTSKHGARYLLKQTGTLPTEAAAPTCQTCHMHEGDHEVRTAWGFLAVRLPMPEDEQWAKDRATILTALGVLDPEGSPTKRLEAVKAADVVRLTQATWQAERDKMLSICSDCHSENFAKGELKKGDEIIRHADRLLAEAIRVVAGLYEDGVLKKPENYPYKYPDLLTFHDAPTVIEQTLFEMHLKHRMRAFQGAFHANPDYSLWYGWSEMRRDLTEIKMLAEEIRREHERGKREQG